MSNPSSRISFFERPYSGSKCEPVTRMSNSKKYGVVDSNCKVFGSENLYMAGSSIFTTGGQLIILN